MSKSQTLTVNWADDSGLTESESFSLTGDVGIDMSVAAADAATTEVDVAIDVSTITGLMLKSDQAVTLKTNSTGSPAATISLAAGVPKFFAPGNPYFGTNPFGSTDVTIIYIVNASGSVANVVMKAMVDAIP